MQNFYLAQMIFQISKFSGGNRADFSARRISFIAFGENFGEFF